MPRAWIGMVLLLVAGCQPAPPAPPPSSPPPGHPPPPIDPGEVSDPAAGCPPNTVERIEPQQDGGALKSCIIPGREVRNTPFRHGPYELTDASGNLKMRGMWRANKYHGVWRFWHPNGTLHRETIYRDGSVQSDANWDDQGRPIDRRDRNGQTNWYSNGHKKLETRVVAPAVIVTTTWFENGRRATRERTTSGRRAGEYLEWYESGKAKTRAIYRHGKLLAWKGWSVSGAALSGASCRGDEDCTVGIKNQCYGCQIPYEAITRWQAAQRLMRPPPKPRGCPRGPFACAIPNPKPGATCRQRRCALAP